MYVEDSNSGNTVMIIMTITMIMTGMSMKMMKTIRTTTKH